MMDLHLGEAWRLLAAPTSRWFSQTGLLIPCLAAALIGAVLPTAACADATRDALTEVAKCADIADSPVRLKCFDAAVPGARSALAAPVPEEKGEGILDWFGFSRPKKPVTKPEDFGKPQQFSAAEITQMSATVLELAKTARGRAIFVLENGQVWRQLEGDDTVVIEPPPGKTMKVTIELGMLGNYNLTIEGRNSPVRVSRLK